MDRTDATDVRTEKVKSNRSERGRLSRVRNS
jgi:hypothetical protein